MVVVVAEAAEPVELQLELEQADVRLGLRVCTSHRPLNRGRRSVQNFPFEAGSILNFDSASA